jgi:hypothetical protein
MQTLAMLASRFDANRLGALSALGHRPHGKKTIALDAAA